MATAANFCWEKAIGPVSEAQGFSGFARNYKALEWARRHRDELTSEQQAATHRAVTGYRFNSYCIGAVIALAAVNATLTLAA